jgi:hypothetical protein
MWSAAVGRPARVTCLAAAVGLVQFSVQAAASPVTPTRAKSSAARVRHGYHASRRAHSRRAHVAIVGGNLIEIAQAPWQVAVEVNIPALKRPRPLLCGGSILNATHVLTAAQCVFDPTTERVAATEDFTVRAGASNLPPAKEPTEQVLKVASIRPHPYFNPEGEPGSPDDVAVLEVTPALTLNSSISSIALLPASSANPSEGMAVNLSGFGEQNPDNEDLNGGLYSLAMTVRYSRMCSGPLGEANALFVCASAPAGSTCYGDSGGALMGTGSSPTLIGVAEYVEQGGDEGSCVAAGIDGFANVAAPEIREFIEGSGHPHHAPRGGGAVIRGVIVAVHSLTCEPGVWSNSPTLMHAFIDNASGEVLQSGASGLYPLSSADVGRAILCEVHAANAGGTGVGRTPALPPIQPAPVVVASHEGGTQAPGGNTMTPPPIAAPEPSRASPTSSTITVLSGGTALARLDCVGQATCHGRIALTAKRTVKSKGKTTSRRVTVGTASFSIPREQAVTARVKLGPVGRSLLAAARGHLAARLTILGIETLPMPAQVRAVSLVLQKGRGKR